MIDTIINIKGIEYTTPKEAAKLLGVCVETIHNFIKQKKLSTLRISARKIYIPLKDINKLIAVAAAK